MPKVPTSTSNKQQNKNKKLKHDPLAKQILDSMHVTEKQRKRKSQEDEFDEEIDDALLEQYLDTKMSNKILQHAKQQDEDSDNEEEVNNNNNNNNQQVNNQFSSKSKLLSVNDLAFKEEDEEDEDVFYEESDNQTLSATDAHTLDLFLGGGAATTTATTAAASATGGGEQVSFFAPATANKTTGSKQQTIQELILQKIREKEAKQANATLSQTEQDVQNKLHPKVVSTYKKLGMLLSRYTSGPLPKAFKVIPSLSNWEEIVYLTNPEKWSYQALYQATRIFVSILDPKMGAHFLSMILLPKFRSDVERSVQYNHHQDSNVVGKRKLNHHIYQSLIKSCYRASAFFKGIVFPLCESGDCSPLEANMIGSIIKKASLPNLHSCAALYRLAQMPFTPTNLFFVKVLLAKRYALPSQVVEALVEYFHQFITNPRLQQEYLHVMWHQTLLLFVQLYKKDFSSAQKSKIYNVCKKRSHNLITPEIRRELNRSASAFSSSSSSAQQDTMTDE